MTRILITGGVRSGKSDFAQKLATGLSKSVLFVATAEAGDEEMTRRIREHRKARPATWRTLEATSSIGGQIVNNIGQADVVVVDCITLLVSNIMGQQRGRGDEVVEAAVKADIGGLLECTAQVNATFIIVTNEVGMGIVPDTSAGRVYRDLLGKANQVLAERCDEVYLMVAGLPLRIKPAASLSRFPPVLS